MAKRIIPFVVFLLVCGVAIGWAVNCRKGVELRLRNETRQPLTNIQIEITGRRYRVERIEPGTLASIHLKPSSESDIKLYIDGYADPLVVDTYFEAGYGGHLLVEINPQGLQIIEDNIGPSIC